MSIVLKSGNLNLLEPSGPVQACNGFASPFILSDLGPPDIYFYVRPVYESLRNYHSQERDKKQAIYTCTRKVGATVHNLVDRAQRDLLTPLRP